MKILKNRQTGESVRIPEDAIIRIRCDGQVTVIGVDGAEIIYDSYHWDNDIKWCDLIGEVTT